MLTNDIRGVRGVRGVFGVRTRLSGVTTYSGRVSGSGELWASVLSRFGADRRSTGDTCTSWERWIRGV
jgi:hypothetical protein